MSGKVGRREERTSQEKCTQLGTVLKELPATQGSLGYVTGVADWSAPISTNIVEHLVDAAHFSSMSDCIRNKRAKNPRLHIYILVASEREQDH